MTRSINQMGEDKIVQWEGEVLWAYDDFDPKHRPIVRWVRNRRQ